MRIRLAFYGVFREKLPAEVHGKMEVELPAGTTIAGVLARYGILAAACAVNGTLQREQQTVLADGDQLQVFRPAGGGDIR